MSSIKNSLENEVALTYGTVNCINSCLKQSYPFCWNHTSRNEKCIGIPDFRSVKAVQSCRSLKSYNRGERGGGRGNMPTHFVGNKR